VAGVVLDELVGSNVPYFDGGVSAARGNECARWMKGNAVDVAGVFVECVNAFFGIPVPQFDCFVV